MAVGTRVRVRLHGRPVGGWISALDVEPPEGVTLQPLTRVSGHGPPPDVVELARWAAWRWAGPVVSFLRTASPPRNVVRLPTPPPRAPLATPGQAEGCSLLRLAPTVDPLPTVLEVLAGAGPGSVLVLVPNLGWAERLAERLRRRGFDVARDWAEAAAGWPVVVGSRAAAWAPVPRLAAAVVLDAHDEAYQQEQSPTANSWEVVAERAARQAAPCRLVSPCPTVVLRSRAPMTVAEGERHGWPRLSVVDLRQLDPRVGLLSEELVRLGRSRQPLVCVYNRVGRGRLLACAACQTLATCERCGRPVAESGTELACRWCGLERPAVCAACGSSRLKTLRRGVARMREELEALFGVPVEEVSGTSRPEDVEPEAPILVGTEAVLHRVRRAAAVAFLDFDQHLLAPRFTAGEDALALLARAARLVGPRTGDGLVLVQTRLPEHDLLRAAVQGDPGLFDETELRRTLDLPPFSALASLSGPGAPTLAGRLEGSMAIDGDRWLVRAPDHAHLCDALARVGRPAERVRVAVDPTDV